MRSPGRFLIQITMYEKIKPALITNSKTRPALRAGSGNKYYLREVRAIIAHWTANTGRGANAQANRNYFNNGSPGPNGTFRAASAHYCVDDKGIIQCLPDNEVGYHVGAVRYKLDGLRIMRGYGGLTPNYFTIGFEMCVNSDGDWQETKNNSIALAAHLLFLHGLKISDLLRHYDITGKDCPKMYVDAKTWNGKLNWDALVEWDSFKFSVELHLSNYYSNYRRAIVSTNGLNVRNGAGTEYGVVEVLKKGDPVIVYIEEKTIEWVSIGENKFVNKRYLS